MVKQLGRVYAEKIHELCCDKWLACFLSVLYYNFSNTIAVICNCLGVWYALFLAILMKYYSY